MACHQTTAPPTWQFQSSRRHWLMWKCDEQWPLGLSIGWEFYHPVEEQKHGVPSTYHVFLQCFHARSLQRLAPLYSKWHVATPGEFLKRMYKLSRNVNEFKPSARLSATQSATAAVVTACHQSQPYLEWHQILESLQLSLKGTCTCL